MTQFKRVPALLKEFNILNFLARSDQGKTIGEIAKHHRYNRSTVYNIVHTLAELGVLETADRKTFCLGHHLFMLGKASRKSSELIHVVRPFLENINAVTKLTVFLGVLHDERVVIIDKIDSPFDIKVSSEIGMRIPLFGGVTGKIVLSQLEDEVFENLLKSHKLKRYTPFSIVDDAEYRREIHQVRRVGAAVDKEGYIEGVRGVGVPLKDVGAYKVAAMWVIGLNSHIRDKDIPDYIDLLKKSALEIKSRL